MNLACCVPQRTVPKQNPPSTHAPPNSAQKGTCSDRWLPSFQTLTQTKTRLRSPALPPPPSIPSCCLRPSPHSHFSVAHFRVRTSSPSSCHCLAHVPSAQRRRPSPPSLAFSLILLTHSHHLRLSSCTSIFLCTNYFPSFVARDLIRGFR